MEKELISLYETAYQLILERVIAKSATGRLTSFEGSLIREIEGILSELDEEVLITVQNGLAVEYEAARRQALSMLGVEAEMTVLHRRAIEVLASNMAGDLLEANQAVGRRVKDIIRRSSLDAVAQKLTAGETVRQAKDNLTNRLAAQGLKRAGGMRLDAYAEMIARSTTREATNLAVMNQVQELDIDLVKMSSHNSPCPVCAQYEGRVYSISGNDSRFPPLDRAFSSGYANIHPRCRHVLSPYIEEFNNVTADRTQSNKPFIDNRTERQRQAYQRGQTKKRRQRRERLRREQERLEAA